MRPTIINVVSGKGGTGKTLLSCVLADMLGNSASSPTVVIDLDFFVRGLTSLLYFHQEERLELVGSDSVTVAELFARKQSFATSQLAILKYRSFEVVPAVARIDQRLNYNDLGPNTRQEAKAVLEALIVSLGEHFRFVILDSRAGYDELVSAAHDVSDASVCVEEQDPISRVTSDNLVSQLSSDSRTPVFRLVNKARGIKSQKDVYSEVRSVTDLGRVPFDMDILNEFGAPDFWDTVNRSLYRWSLARAWNVLNAKLKLGAELSEPRVSPLISESVEERVSFLSIRERIIFVYGLFLSIFGITYAVFGGAFLQSLAHDPIRFGSLIAGLFGSGVVFYTFLKGRGGRSN